MSLMDFQRFVGWTHPVKAIEHALGYTNWCTNCVIRCEALIGSEA